MIAKIIEVALETKPAGEGSQFTPEEKRLQAFNNVNWCGFNLILIFSGCSIVSDFSFNS